MVFRKQNAPNSKYSVAAIALQQRVATQKIHSQAQPFVQRHYGVKRNHRDPRLADFDLLEFEQLAGRQLLTQTSYETV